eukprot:SAG31_NODE_6591_length_1959_cov_3.953226_2_plen_121_part_00
MRQRGAGELRSDGACSRRWFAARRLLRGKVGLAVLRGKFFAVLDLLYLAYILSRPAFAGGQLLTACASSSSTTLTVKPCPIYLQTASRLQWQRAVHLRFKFLVSTPRIFRMHHVTVLSHT